MKQPEIKNGEKLAAAITTWFKTKVPQASDLELLTFKPPSDVAGFSGDTYLAEFGFTEDSSSRRQKYVIRMEVAKAHNPVSNFDKLVRLQSILGGIEHLRVPKILYVENDPAIIGGPFCFMEFVAGKPAPDSPPMAASGWVFDASEQQRRKMYRSGIQFLAELHKIEINAYPLDFLYLDQPGKSQVERYINMAIEMHGKNTDGKFDPLTLEAIDYLQRNLPDNPPEAIYWGDARPANMLWKDFTMTAALDWEGCGIGPAAMDIADWLLADYGFTKSIGLPRLPGMLEKNEFIEVYQEFNPIDLSDIDYYRVMKSFTNSVMFINMLIKFQGAGKGFFAGCTLDNNPMTNTLKDWLQDVR